MKKAGDYTLEELDIAAASSDEKNISERVCVLCRQNPYTSDNESLKKLGERLSEHRILQKQYEHIDTVKLALTTMLLNII